MKKKINSFIGVVLALAVVFSTFAGMTVSAEALSRPYVQSVTTDCVSVTIKWAHDNLEQNPVQFLVYRKGNAEGDKWGRIGVTKIGATSYKDKTVKSGQTYYYTVKAYYKDADGEKHLSKSSGDYKIKVVPSKPAFSLISNCGTGVVMQWKERRDVTGFVIYRSETAAKGSWKKIATIRNNKAGQFIDTKVNIGETYYYLIKAYKTINGKNCVSDISKIHKRIISDVSTPENLDATPTSDGILVSFDKVPGTQGYAVYRRDAGKSNWKRIATLKSVNKLEYLDKTAEFGRTYYYTVKSYKTVNGKTYYSAGAQSVPATDKKGVCSINASVNEVIFSELLEEYVINIKVDGQPKYDTLQFEIEDGTVAAGKWGKWNDDDTIDLTVTRIGPGETTLRIYYESVPDADVYIDIYAAKLELDDDYEEAKALLKEAYDIFGEALSLLADAQGDDISDVEKAQLVSEAIDKASEVAVVLEDAKVLAEKYAEFDNSGDLKLIESLLRFTTLIEDWVNADSVDSPLVQPIISGLKSILESVGVV